MNRIVDAPETSACSFHGSSSVARVRNLPRVMLRHRVILHHVVQVGMLRVFLRSERGEKTISDSARCAGFFQPSRDFGFGDLGKNRLRLSLLEAKRCRSSVHASTNVASLGRNSL